MVAYRLEPKNGLTEEISEYLYDIDEDYTSKAKYITRAEKLTAQVNTKFQTNYFWNDLFETPRDIGWRYCKKCGSSYWRNDCCDC